MLFPHPTPETFKLFSAYPLIFVHIKTNEVICEKCAKEMSKEEIQEEGNNIFKDYIYDIYYEGSSIFCDKCNKETESAYGDPEEDMI